MQINKEYMVGTDTSHHNPEFYRNMGCWDFEIHKLTEGTSFISSTVERWWNDRKHEKKLSGVYHMLNEKNVQAQVDFALSKFTEMKMVGRAIFIVDYELPEIKPESSAGVFQLKQFVREVKNATNGKWQPFVYCNKSCRKAIMNITDEWRHWCLWLADYQEVETIYSDGWNPIMRQWTTCGDKLDINMFYGSEGSWESLILRG